MARHPGMYWATPNKPICVLHVDDGEDLAATQIRRECASCSGQNRSRGVALQWSARGGGLQAGRGLSCPGKRAVCQGGGPERGRGGGIETLTFPGGYRDEAGYEAITWRVEGSRRYKLPSLDVFTTIRGIEVQGTDFDGLEPVDPSAVAGQLPLDQVGELTGCVLSGDLPCTIAVSGRRHPADDWFEDGVQRLERALPPGAQLVCCVTCLFSDYSPGGHGLTGIRCHRGAKEQYLAVRSKTDYWPVPVTEEVPETYLCQEYQRRIPGTGYRG